MLYHDNYYRDQSDIPLEERRKTNYDHPDAMETELLVRQLQELKEGKTIQCPTYDYTLHTRSSEVVTVEPKKSNFIRRNPCPGRRTAERSDGYQGVCRGRCR